MAVAIKIQAILPDDEIAIKNLERNVEAALRGPAKRIMKKEMNKTVKNWDTPIQMVGRYSNIKGAVGSMLVFPRGEGRRFWAILDQGAKGRTIAAVNAPALRYRPGYAPKTRPGGRWGGSGRRSGPLITAKSVNWPGIEARNFEKEVAKNVEPELVKIVQAALEL
jgi:hypothetical protein